MTVITCYFDFQAAGAPKPSDLNEAQESTFGLPDEKDDLRDNCDKDVTFELPDEVDPGNLDMMIAYICSEVN